MPAKSRQQFIKSLAILTVLATAFTVSPAVAQRLRIIPVPPNVKAQWTPIPDLPQVSYAPNIPTDVFRHRGRYYFYWEGVWYQSKNINGPYSLQQRPPAILSNIQAAYFKTLPRAQPPAAEAPGAPPYEGLVTPEGKPVEPPAPPVSPTPPSSAYAPPPEPVTPPQPPETAQPPEQETQASPETQEPAPQAVPEGAMPKAM